MLNYHILACARCLAGKVCGLVRSTWGTSLGEDKVGARDRILNRKVARRACTGRAQAKYSPHVPRLCDVAIVYLLSTKETLGSGTNRCRGGCLYDARLTGFWKRGETNHEGPGHF